MRSLSHKRMAGITAGLCAVLVSSAAAGWPLALTASTSRAPSRAPSQATVAGRLARQLTTAQTPAKRYQALVATMRALHIGVYRGSGRPIVRGAERTKNDLYVYDFTLTALAGNMANHKTITVDQLAAQLNAATAPVRKRTITGAMLRSAMQSSARWAIRHPRSDTALGELLIREIGRRRVHQDVARPPALQQMKLDDVQAFLVSADLTAAIVTRSWHSRAGAAVSTRPARGSSLIGDLCKELKPAYKAYKIIDLGIKLYKAGSLAAGVQGIVTKIVITNLTVGMINAYVIDNYVEFTAVGPTQDGTHYGPAHRAPEAGKHLNFKAHLRMSLNIPDWAAKCGYLTGLFSKYTGGGLKLPAGGDLPGVPVSWEYSPTTKEEAKLEAHGTVLSLTATDSQGDTWLSFAPKEEFIPGVGEERAYAGSIAAKVNVQEFFGGPLDDLSPNLWSLMPPKSVSFAYAIGAHRARGYRIYAAPGSGVLRDDFGFGYDDLISISAKVCGENPYAQPWSATAVAKNHEGDTVMLTGSFQLSGPNSWTPVENMYQDGIVWELKVSIPAGQDPAYMTLTGDHNRTGSVNAAIEENPDCPPVP